MAIAILIYGHTHSAFLTALAYVLTCLPPIAGGPLLSGLADMFLRPRVMIVFGSRMLLTLLLFGWLAGFCIVPEGLAAPSARSLHGSMLTLGLLMAAMPLGAFLLGRVAAVRADQDDGLAHRSVRL